ncbi:MAG: hypothetical protein HY609_05415 [Deltaproteobacteria bacterium]|nr:hypothetical protein [Deltaproteobacteria bacterium]MBI4224352.1 hypothetical protein [Deltaproteobacteria bacterium]
MRRPEPAIQSDSTSRIPPPVLGGRTSRELLRAIDELAFPVCAQGVAEPCVNPSQHRQALKNLLKEIPCVGASWVRWAEKREIAAKPEACSEEDILRFMNLIYQSGWNTNRPSAIPEYVRRVEWIAGIHWQDTERFGKAFLELTARLPYTEKFKGDVIRALINVIPKEGSEPLDPVLKERYVYKGLFWLMIETPRDQRPALIEAIAKERPNYREELFRGMRLLLPKNP